MKAHSRVFSVILFLSTAMFGCSTHEENKEGTENNKQNSGTAGQVKNEAPPESVILKETVINAKTVADNKRISRALNQNEINRLSLRSIDSSASDAAFKYDLIDTLFSGSQIDIYLIGREHTEENIVWVMSYDNDSKLIDLLQVYYDNSEGSLAKESFIKDKSISVKTINEYAEMEKDRLKNELYYFNENNRLVKQ